MLNELGFRRLEEDGFRRDDAARLEVYLAWDREGSALLRKVRDDSSGSVSNCFYQ